MYLLKATTNTINYISTTALQKKCISPYFETLFLVLERETFSEATFLWLHNNNNNTFWWVAEGVIGAQWSGPAYPGCVP